MTITKAQRAYQSGMTRDEAIAYGASAHEFDQLQDRYQGASIPIHVLHGFKPTAPYSCAYHTGGPQGTLLRAVIKQVANPAE